MGVVSKSMQAKASSEELSLNILGIGSLEMGSNRSSKRSKLSTTWLHLPIAKDYKASLDL
jgi:hypothetical protein